MQTIVLYGNSLALSAIGAGLRQVSDLRVVRVSARPADADTWLAAFDPIAVVFDRLATPPDFAIALLDHHPEVLFVGFDPSGERLLVLSGCTRQPESAAELLQVIAASGPARSDRSWTAQSMGPVSSSNSKEDSP